MRLLVRGKSFGLFNACWFIQVCYFSSLQFWLFIHFICFLKNSCWSYSLTNFLPLLVGSYFIIFILHFYLYFLSFFRYFFQKFMLLNFPRTNYWFCLLSIWLILLYLYYFVSSWFFEFTFLLDFYFFLIYW